MILWDIKDINAKEHKHLRVNIEFDYASHVAWSPDSKAFIVHKVRDNNIVVYKIEKKKDGAIGSAAPVITFDKVRPSHFSIMNSVCFSNTVVLIKYMNKPIITLSQSDNLLQESRNKFVRKQCRASISTLMFAAQLVSTDNNYLAYAMSECVGPKELLLLNLEGRRAALAFYITHLQKHYYSSIQGNFWYLMHD